MPYLTLSLLVASGTGFSHRDVVDLCYYRRRQYETLKDMANN